MRKFLTIALLIIGSCVAYAQGPCPASAPVAGSHCKYIADSGSDSNNGNTESTPWLHAPGMPNCSGACATYQTSLGSAGTANGEVGLIFKGGDTWHFGNSSASPYTGGTWIVQWDGTSAATCMYEGTQTGCFYVGVDPTWFTGGSWARPILNGDNPLSTNVVSSCTYQTGPDNVFVTVSASPYQYWDSFEFTGLCSSDVAHVGDASFDTMFLNNGCGNPSVCSQMTLLNNFYMHGWTVSTATLSNGALQCYAFGGGALTSYTLLVIDGFDSDPRTCAWGIFPDIMHMKDSIIRYTTQGVANWCHDFHDDIWEFFYNPYVATHGNALECNQDGTGNAIGQPQNTPNVYYNNIMRHFDPSFGIGGQVDLWFCPTTVPEYWFNNLTYDLNPTAHQGSWDIAGAPTYASCNQGTGSGMAMFMFNNTLVDTIQPCYLGPNTSGSVHLTIANEHLINSPLDGTGNPPCTGVASATNIAMSDATATSLGFTTGSSGTAFTNTCANDPATPCVTLSGTSGVNSTGTNLQSYCTTLASFSGEYAIGTEAANACKNGTTDGCTYNQTTHTMVCTSTGTPRPISAAWDSGAYQYAVSALLTAVQIVGHVIVVNTIIP